MPARKRLKDGVARDSTTAFRLPAELHDWLVQEAARRTLATSRRVSTADVVIEALRRVRSTQGLRVRRAEATRVP